jgi:phage repressor protein C with HTH and peptisase S24 domain
MEPVFRAGAIVIVSPGSGIRRGDRVVVKTRDGEVMAKELVRRTARRIELKSVNRARRDPVLAANDVAWLARILWVSQ